MEDEKIVSLFWERDERALHETAEKYGRYCARIAENILGNGEDAKECVNDAYLGAWNSIPPHRPRCLASFLGRITRNLALNQSKRVLAKKRGGTELSLVLDELCELVSGESDVERELEQKELLCAVNAFLASLPVKKRSIFVCRYWYFEGIAEIARRFGMRETHVSVTLSRLRSALRRYLSERGFDL